MATPENISITPLNGKWEVSCSLPRNGGEVDHGLCFRVNTRSQAVRLVDQLTKAEFSEAGKADDEVLHNFTARV